MCYWVITKGGKVLAETSLQHVIRDDLLNPEISQQIKNFNEALNVRLEDTNFKISGMGNFALDEDDYDLPQWDLAYGDNMPSTEEYGPEMETAPLAEADELEPEIIHKYIGANVILCRRDN